MFGSLLPTVGGEAFVATGTGSDLGNGRMPEKLEAGKADESAAPPQDREGRKTAARRRTKVKRAGCYHM